MTNRQGTGGAPRPAPMPPEALRAAIRRAVDADLTPVRARSLGARALLVLAGAGLALAMPGLAMNMMGGAGMSGDGAAAAAGAIVMVLGAVAIVGSFGPVGRFRFGPRQKLAALVVLHLGWLGYLFVIASGPISSGAAHKAAFMCATGSIVPGFLSGAIAIWAFRGADPWTPRRSGALVGAAGGCIAAAGLGFGCRSVELGHLLLGHGLVVPLLALAGALAARSTLRP